jgi:tetratricopeptide (TPR) repeat protein
MFCRATALQDLGREAKAIDGYEAVLERAPKHAEAANNLGAIHRERGEPAAAAFAFRRAVAARPAYPEALCNLGNAMADAGWAADAVPVLAAAADARPDDLDLQLTLFDCLVQADRADEAERRARAVLDAHPQAAAVAAALGAALQYLGRPDEARTIFLSAIAADPACSRAHQGVAEDRKEAGKDEHIRTLRAALDTASRDACGSPGLNFALGRHLAAAERYEEALEAYVRANELKRAMLARRGFGYSRQDMRQQVDALCAAFPSEALQRTAPAASSRPVFIVGMPRSGTTLTEQILASHPLVFGAGELGYMGQVVEQLRRELGYPRALAPDDALAAAGAFYVQAIGRLDNRAARVTDKMPANFLHLGLIARLFPNARIVHCRRSPMDTCLSCFQQNFRAAHLSWSCDLADLGHYFCQYDRLMENWRKVLPSGVMLEVDYEDTVADLESQARRIVEFVGLDWDDSCLRFHETDRAVVTASHSQVRRKVYATSVGRWKRYGDGLRPLIAALAECGSAPAGGRA